MSDTADPSPNSPVALVIADFMFGARVQAALTQMGWTPKMAGTPQSAAEALSSGRVDLILLELGAGNPARLQLIRDLREGDGMKSQPVLAFGSHKAKAMLEEARDAGATLVVSNGTLVSRFKDVVEKAVSATIPEDERLLTEDDEE